MMDENDAAELVDLEASLAPVDEEVAFINAQLRLSHGPLGDFSEEQKRFRAPLYEQLTELSERFGRLRIRRAELRRLAKSVRQQASS